jgi:hypothetical protein
MVAVFRSRGCPCVLPEPETPRAESLGSENVPVLYVASITLYERAFPAAPRHPLRPCMPLVSERTEESSREVVIITLNRRDGIRIGVGCRDSCRS